MKKFLSYLPLSAAALVALSFAACTDSESISDDLPIGTKGNPEDVLSFSTYLNGTLDGTRAGAAGSIDTEKLKEAEYGFGVFGYYTGTSDYTAFRQTTGSGKYYPNFMYNQMVKYNSAASETAITKWEYTPIKYWPNEVQAGDVDDQNEDRSLDPAQSTGTYGGKVSFFAYAPYVDIVSQENATGIEGFMTSTNSDERGIISFSGNKFNGKDGYYSDPYLTYIISENAKNVVDLLWGTANNSDVNVVGQLNQGVTGDGNADNDAGTGGYVQNILDKYTLNADMTKQTTKGLVKFLFKHALSKVGGSYTSKENDGKGSDEDPDTKTNGLMVVLDLDNEGAEDGGELEPYMVPISKLEPGSDPDQNKYNTKVTVEKIELSSQHQLKDEAAAAKVQAGEKITDTDWEEIQTKGLFNLATGQWTDKEHVTNISQIIQTSTGTDTDGNPVPATGADAVLHENIAEPITAPDYTKTDFEQKLPIGVTTVPKNVYGDDSAPFVFIPGTRPIIEISITYVVRTYDPNLGDVYSEVRQRITKNLYITKPVELNKQYNILIHLGLTSVKFEATVADWDVAQREIDPVPDPETGEPVPTYEEEIEHVWLPRNVGDATKDVTFTSRFTTDADAHATIASAEYFASTAITDAITFSDPTVDSKSVNNTHIAMSSKDLKGNDVDWVTFTGDESTKKVSLMANGTLQERTAIIYATYDNKTTPVMTITQRPSFIKEATLSLVDIPTNTVPSAEATYATQLNVTKIVNVNANGVAGTTETAKSLTLTKGFTLAESADWVEANAENLEVKAYNKMSTPRTTTVTATYKYDAAGATTTFTTPEMTLTQSVATIGSVTLQVEGASSYTAPDYQGATLNYTFIANIIDSDKQAQGTYTPAASQYSYTGVPSWITVNKGKGAGTFVLDTNTGAERTATITLTYDLYDKSSSVTITQPAAVLRINVNNATIPSTANSEISVVNVSRNNDSSDNVKGECTFSIVNSPSWASINSEGVITVQKNTGDERTLTVKAVHSSGISTTRTLTQSAGALTAAEEYTYPSAAPYTYKGTFDATSTNVNYSIAATTLASDNKAIMNDFARYLGALWRCDEGKTVNKISYKSTEYTWNAASARLGSNWENSGATLVSVLTSEFAADVASAMPGSTKSFTMTLEDVNGVKTNITIKATIQ